MASASAAASYKPMDGGKLGLPSSNQPIIAPFWTASTVYAAGATVINGHFLYSTVAGGTGASGGTGPSPNTLADNTVTWVNKGPAGGFAQVDVVQLFELYDIVISRDFSLQNLGMAEFLYVQFSGACSPGDAVAIDRYNKTCVQLPTAAPGASKFTNSGICMGIVPATGYWGWVMVRGIYDQVNVTAALTVGTTMSGGGAAAGRLNQGVANYTLDAMVLKAAGVVGTGVVELYWPYCAGR